MGGAPKRAVYTLHSVIGARYNNIYSLHAESYCTPTVYMNSISLFELILHVFAKISQSQTNTTEDHSARSTEAL